MSQVTSMFRGEHSNSGILDFPPSCLVQRVLAHSHFLGHIPRSQTSMACCEFQSQVPEEIVDAEGIKERL